MDLVSKTYIDYDISMTAATTFISTNVFEHVSLDTQQPYLVQIIVSSPPSLWICVSNVMLFTGMIS